MQRLAAFAAALLVGCGSSPLPENTSVTLTNTFQSAPTAEEGGTGGVELPIEVLAGVDSGTLARTVEVSADSTEIEQFVSLWNIDLREDAIEFTSIVDCDDPPYFPGYCRVLEPGTFDRYCFDVGDLLLPDASSPASSIRVEQLADGRLLVELGEGHDTGSTGFTVLLD